MSIDAMLTALYFVLAAVTISFGNIHFSLAALPAVVAVLLFGGSEGVVVALLGETLLQFFSYGFGITTPLWILPPVIRIVLIALVAFFYRRQGEMLDHHPVIYLITLFAAAILTTALNTLVMYLDALIIGYSLKWVLWETIVRFLTGLGSALLVYLTTRPLLNALRRLTLNYQSMKR
jgi:uncharacterized membrane protein